MHMPQVVAELRALNPDAQIILLGYTNPVPLLPEWTQLFRRLNALSKSLAAQNENVTYVPIPFAMTATDAHPTVSGHKYIANRILRAIKNNHNAPCRAACKLSGICCLPQKSHVFGALRGVKYFASFWQSFPARRALPCAAALVFVLRRLRLYLQFVYQARNNTLWPSKSTHWFFRVHRLRIRVDTLCPKEVFYMDANKYRTAYDKAQAVQHEVWTELCQHLEHAPDAQLLSDYTATLVYTLDKDRREEALRLLRGQLYSRQLRDTGRVESWFTDCGARMGQDIEGFVANARQQYVQAGLAEEQRAEAEAKQKAGRGRFRIRPASAFAPERAAYLVQPYLPRAW